ncbi:hypothetical protein KSP39_PZI011557 [Platanthera zijinensis]|uniref:Uncharacterized protein n=1 Tax=Platanthera zijinensis TaxID=2320716 RepID=A0AAP0G643_9ASPA
MQRLERAPRTYFEAYEGSGLGSVYSYLGSRSARSAAALATTVVPVCDSSSKKWELKVSIDTEARTPNEEGAVVSAEIWAAREDMEIARGEMASAIRDLSSSKRLLSGGTNVDMKIDFQNFLDTDMESDDIEITDSVAGVDNQYTDIVVSIAQETNGESDISGSHRISDADEAAIKENNVSTFDGKTIDEEQTDQNDHPSRKDRSTFPSLHLSNQLTKRSIVFSQVPAFFVKLTERIRIFWSSICRLILLSHHLATDEPKLFVEVGLVAVTMDLGHVPCLGRGVDDNVGTFSHSLSGMKSLSEETLKAACMEEDFSRL